MPADSAVGGDRLIVVRPGDGEAIGVGASTALMGRSEWTDGGVCVLDQIVTPKLISPVHMHAVESQAAYVVSGTLRFWVDGDEGEATTGAYVFRPVGKPHALWNPTDEPVHMLEITSPAERFQEYMVELGELRDAGTADPETVKRLGARYGVTFFDEITEELSRRHGLTPSGSFWK
jgi:mannose-6-phosphate isomerase-like protein (cupin superfamily)